MKKIYTLLFIACAFVSNGQNLVTNPSFENGLTGWTAGPTASYTLPSIVANDGQDGSNSVNYVPTATTGFFQEIPVVGGSKLVISFYYKASGDDTDARIWSNYKDDKDVIVYQDALNTNDPLRNNNGYLPTSLTWTKHTIEVTAPANATKLVLAFRAYKPSAVSGNVSFDNMSVVQSTLGFQKNSISGLNVYPNPVKNGTVFITSNNSTSKTVAVYDILGKQVLSGKTASNAVNVSALRSGSYILRITEEGKTDTKKLIIE